MVRNSNDDRKTKEQWGIPKYAPLEKGEIIFMSKEDILKGQLSELELEIKEIERKARNVKNELRELRAKKSRNKDNNKYKFDRKK